MINRQFMTNAGGNSGALLGIKCRNNVFKRAGQRYQACFQSFESGVRFHIESVSLGGAK